MPTPNPTPLPQQQQQPTTSSLFFYGTLMAPSVLHRVISSSSTTSTYARTSPPLAFHPALLPHHRRRHVRGADYPAVTPSASENSSEDSSVRGTLVTGLTPRDLQKLDLFEGDEYERREVRVRLLPDTIEAGGGVPEPLAYGGITPVAPTIPASSSSRGALGKGGRVVHDIGGDEGVTTQTYIWTSAESELEEGEWDFEHFRREKLHLWDGLDVDDEGLRAVDALGAHHDGLDGEGEGGGEGVNGAYGGKDGQVDGGKGGQVDGTRGRGKGGAFEEALRKMGTEDVEDVTQYQI